MTASITIYTEEIKDIMLVPAKAIQFRPDSVLSGIYEIERGKDQRRHPNTSPTSDSSQAGTRAVVWIKQDSSLVMRPVITGQDDETQVQIISGLAITDEVVTGYKEVSKNKKTTTTEKSPFLPARPGGNRSGSGTQQGPPR
jgi:HlyD family secretion protein